MAEQPPAAVLSRHLRILSTPGGGVFLVTQMVPWRPPRLSSAARLRRHGGRREARSVLAPSLHSR